MSRRINIMVDDDTWKLLGKIPAGARSRTINDALRAWALSRQRKNAVRALDALRMRLPAASAAEVVQWIREDREHGH